MTFSRPKRVMGASSATAAHCVSSTSAHGTPTRTGPQRHRGARRSVRDRARDELADVGAQLAFGMARPKNGYLANAKRQAGACGTRLDPIAKRAIDATKLIEKVGASSSGERDRAHPIGTRHHQRIAQTSTS